MNARLPRLTVVLGILLLSGAATHAQSSPEVFVSIADHPFGPGDRAMTAKIKLLPGETTGNVEAWVIYADSRDAVAAGQLNGPAPHGKAKLGVVDSTGVLSVSFVFPHTDHPTPNAVDRNARKYPGGKKLYYKWVKRKGQTQTASQIIEFTLPDKLTVVNFGDSYGSGEGAPYSSGPKWGSTGEQCHRSGNSGQAKAVRAYKQANSHTAVAFKNVACSGAGVRDGITGSQAKKGFLESEDFPTRVKPQYQQAKEWLAQNGFEQTNIAIVSIVGNDIGFGPLVRDFFIAPGNIADPNDAGAKRARDNTALNIAENIPLNYDELKTVFDANFDYDHVLVTAYPDPTRDKDGRFCRQVLTYGACWGPVELLNTEAEFQFAFTHILSKMNAAIKEKVRAFPNWTFLEGTVARAQRNGMCNCDDPYFNTIGASVVEQGDVFGVMHPNRRGHEKIYYPVVYDGLKTAIFKIRKEYARERAMEIAKEAAIRKARMAAAQRRIAQSQVVQRPVGVSQEIPADVLQKARETAAKMRPVSGVADSPHADDHEK
jgi:hypothetical protein